MRILILGGTHFLGRHMSKAALTKGFDLTLFNRGKTNSDLFPEAKKIIGDRYKDIEKLSDEEPWDCIIDCCEYFPKKFEKIVETLKSKTKKYVLISTASVYASFDANEIDETFETSIPEKPEDLDANTNETYGIRKKACEDVLLKTCKEKAWIIRPGIIVGPYDPSWRFPYWIDRVTKGGEMIAPGDKKDSLQFIDARDLSEWVMNNISSSITGIYNAVGPQTAITWGDFLESCVKTLNSKANLRWLDSKTLAEKDISPWVEMPLWLTHTSRGLNRVCNKKAVEDGFISRPIVETIKDTSEWIIQDAVKGNGNFGISTEKEKAVLDSI